MKKKNETNKSIEEQSEDSNGIENENILDHHNRNNEKSIKNIYSLFLINSTTNG